MTNHGEFRLFSVGARETSAQYLSTMRKTAQIAHFAVSEHKHDSGFTSLYVHGEQ